MHVALYVLMIVMPLAGWLLISAEVKSIPFFGLHLPALTGISKYLADLIKEIPEAGGSIGYFSSAYMSWLRYIIITLCAIILFGECSRTEMESVPFLHP